MESSRNSESHFVDIGIVVPVTDSQASEEGKTVEQSVPVWSDYLLLIPHFQKIRKDSPNAAIARAFNSTILTILFSSVEGFLWDFLEAVMVDLKLNNKENTVLQRIIEDYLNNKKKSWEFDNKAALLKVLTNIDVKALTNWQYISALREFRNILAHGGNVSIGLGSKEPAYYSFEKGLCNTILTQTGIIKPHEKDKFSEEGASDNLIALFSDEISDFYYIKVKAFLVELNAQQPNQAHKNDLASYTLNFSD